jgi:hypothetical protein
MQSALTGVQVLVTRTSEHAKSERTIICSFIGERVFMFDYDTKKKEDQNTRQPIT